MTQADKKAATAEAFGEQIERIRESLDLSRQQVAETMGEAYSYVYNIEWGDVAWTQVRKLLHLKKILRIEDKQFLKLLKLLDTSA